MPHSYNIEKQFRKYVNFFLSPDLRDGIFSDRETKQVLFLVLMVSCHGKNGWTVGRTPCYFKLDTNELRHRRKVNRYCIFSVSVRGVPDL